MNKTTNNNMPHVERNHHFIFIEAPMSMVFEEIVAWGEATWWPRKSRMKFIRKVKGDIQIGTQYIQKVKGLFKPKWMTEVTQIVPQRLIERTFKTGMFRGYEVVKLEERSNGTRVDYEMLYFINGFWNRFLWNTKFLKQHDQNIEWVLDSMKKYIDKKLRSEFEKGWEKP